MKRREFLRLAAMTPLYVATPLALAGIDGSAADWRSFELTYELDFSTHPSAGQVWLPLPQNADDFQRVLSVAWQGQALDAVLHWDPLYQAPVFSARISAAIPAAIPAAQGEVDRSRTLKVTAQVATRDRHRAAAGDLQSAEAAALYLKPTTHMPTDGIVAETAQRITQGMESPDAKARAIYDWIVDNTFREPKTRGCGLGDIKFMLETGNLGGKCADINSLFVGLARAAGLPAREMYGVRVAESKQFQSLGKAGDISKAQHCRAEYFSPRYGWVPIDAADVRKVVLEAKLDLHDPQIKALRERLFGYWEMNWVGFNTARDFALTPAARGPVPYLMYPYAEFGDTVLDGRDPKDFFKLTSRALTA